MNSVTVAFCISQSDADKIVNLATEKGISKSQVIRELVKKATSKTIGRVKPLRRGRKGVADVVALMVLRLRYQKKKSIIDVAHSLNLSYQTTYKICRGVSHKSVFAKFMSEEV